MSNLQTGLTMVEVLISLGISVIIGSLLLVIIVNSSYFYSKESSKLTEGLNINDALSELRGSIKQAGSVAASYSSDSQIFTSGTTQLVLKVPAIDSSGNIITNAYDHFIFFLDQNKLRYKTFIDSQSVRVVKDQILSTLVDRVVFEYFSSSNPPLPIMPSSAGKVKITLILKQKSKTDDQISIATAEANLRND